MLRRAALISIAAFWSRALAATTTLLMMTLLLALPRPGLTFVPSYWMGAALGGGASHQTITEAVILGGTVCACENSEVSIDPGLVKEFFEVEIPTKKMKDAADQIQKANQTRDRPENQKPLLHFDAEALGFGQLQIHWMARTLIAALLRDDAGGAREALGWALHTLQDFYAHTNWVELGNKGIEPALIPPSNLDLPFPPFSFRIASTNEATCDGIEPDPDLNALTSGYYDDSASWTDPPTLKQLKKCIHGGAYDSLIGTFGVVGINKDSLNVGDSPHRDWHSEAASLAAAASQEFIRKIRENLVSEVGQAVADRKISLLLGADALAWRNNNLVSAVTLQIDLDNGLDPFPVTKPLAPQEENVQKVPDLSAAGTHKLVVRGTSSESATGLIGYTLTLPSFLEFADVVSDRGGGPVPLSGRTHSDLLVLKPPLGSGAPAHRANTYTIKVSMP
jgi:von Willebrand factor A domain-containing protein 7